MPDKEREDKALPPEEKKPGVNVHFGNVEIVKLRLLEAIAKNTAETAKLLRKLVEEK